MNCNWIITLKKTKSCRIFHVNRPPFHTWKSRCLTFPKIIQVHQNRSQLVISNLLTKMRLSQFVWILKTTKSYMGGTGLVRSSRHHLYLNIICCLPFNPTHLTPHASETTAATQYTRNASKIIPEGPIIIIVHRLGETTILSG
jgi:hypothetical protein